MDADGDMDRLARKGLAEGLSDDEIFELLTDHDIPQDKAETILQDVKEALRTPHKNAREALADQAPDMSSPSESSNDDSDEDVGESFEEAFEENVEDNEDEESSADEEESAFKELDTSGTESSQQKSSFNEFDEDIEPEDNEASSDGIFSRLAGLFSSSEQSGDDDTTSSSQDQNRTAGDLDSDRENQPPENPDWDAEALKELAREAIDKGLAEEEILSLFIDHGVPESYTKQLLENARQEREEPDQDVTSEEMTEATGSDEGEAEPVEEDSLDDGVDELDLDDLTEDSESEVEADESFEEAFEDDVGEDASNTVSPGESTDDNQSGGRMATSTDTSKDSGEEVKKRSPTSETRESTTNVSAAKLDQETLQAMAQHGIAKGFDREELVAFFKDHGVEETRARKVIATVLPSNNQNTQGRKQSEHEGHTETSEAKDAVAVQKQAQVTTAKDEEESFMSDMDKSQESLKVGRIYLTGRKPSYGRMRVRGLQDITGNEFESGGRTGFIDLSDTEEHIGGEEEESMDDSQQVGDDRIREQA